ncbi:MAG: heavy metal-binding protein [Alteromonadaceae bacterium]|nr:heavy metal-binding protein [Alteromonadaceae bacterium]
MTTTMLKIKGMTCGHCQRAVTQALENVDGVKSAVVDLEAGTAAVQASESTATEALLEAVREEGYDANLQ